ncbi:MAG: hypothetical protein AAFO91_17360, partial [Bacteroidota bacterium]
FQVAFLYLVATVWDHIHAPPHPIRNVEYFVDGFYRVGVAGDIMKGIKKPFECPNFGTKCKPENPLGAPMVSSEGACAAYYHFSDQINRLEEQVLV